jgi:uncharacterized protein YlxP (DUF503 family)
VVVGSLEVTLRLHGVRSLKEKRRIRQSVVSKLRNGFKVAVAETDDQDTWDALTIGVATVGPHRGPVEQVLRDASDWIAASGVGEVLDERLEIERY